MQKRKSQKKVMRPAKILASSLLSSTRTFSGLPPSFRTRLVYSDAYGITGQGGVLTYYSWRANGVYDPDLTGTGHQPMGRDTYAALYNHCCVINSAVNLKFVSQDHTYASACPCGVLLHEDGTLSASSGTALIEQGASSWTVTSLRATTPVMLGKTYDAKEWFGIKDIEDNMDRIGSPVGSNPTEIAAFSFWCQPGATTASGGLYLIVNIVYDVLWTEPTETAAN